MQKKYTYTILLFAVAALILPFAQTALALEVNYPVLGGIDLSQLANQKLPQLIAYFFYFFIAISGFIGVIAIVIAGFEFLISAGNETLITEAKDRIRSAILGILLLMAVFILVKAINPELVNLRTTTLTNLVMLPNGTYQVRPVQGQLGLSPNNHNLLGIPYVMADNEDDDDICENVDDCITYGLMEYWVAPLENSDLSDDDISVKPSSFIHRKCDADSADNVDSYEYEGSVETFQLYPQKNYIESSGVRSVDLECGGVISLDGVQSYKRRIREPGIYLYSESGCEGDSSYQAITTTQDIPNDFLDLKSLKIINDIGNDNPDDDTYWGVVVNASSDSKGECSQPAINITKSNVCAEVSLKFVPRFINVFNWNSKYDDKKNYQNGLTIYGMPVEIETPPADTGDSGSDSGDEPANEQDYYYTGADKIQNHWYYVQEGYADHKAGYFTQAYYNISAQQIIDKINQNGKGYYTCFNDPGLLLKKTEDGSNPCDSSGGSNVCQVDNPPASASQKNCLVPNSPYCIQSVVSRDKYLYMLYAQNENGDNRTCSTFTDDTIDLQGISFMQNGKELYRLNIIPIK